MSGYSCVVLFCCYDCWPRYLPPSLILFLTPVPAKISKPCLVSLELCYTPALYTQDDDSCTHRGVQGIIKRSCCCRDCTDRQRNYMYNRLYQSTLEPRSVCGDLVRCQGCAGMRAQAYNIKRQQHGMIIWTRSSIVGLSRVVWVLGPCQPFPFCPWRSFFGSCSSSSSSPADAVSPLRCVVVPPQAIAFLGPSPLLLGLLRRNRPVLFVR